MNLASSSCLACKYATTDYLYRLLVRDSGTPGAMPLHKPADTVKTEALESSIVLLTRMCLLLENSGSIPKLAFGATRQCNANLQMQMQKCNAICNCNCNSDAVR